MEIKNGIIIYGVLHELVETKRNDCSKCSLRNECYSSDYLICDMFGAGKYEYFVNRGKVSEDEEYEKGCLSIALIVVIIFIVLTVVILSYEL